MYYAEILDPRTGQTIEKRAFHSEYEAMAYGQQYQNFMERFY